MEQQRNEKIQMDKKNHEVGTRTITIYKNTFDSKNPHHIDVTKALERIKSGHSKEWIEGLRALPITEEFKEQRSTLKKICQRTLFRESLNGERTMQSRNLQD